VLAQSVLDSTIVGIRIGYGGLLFSMVSLFGVAMFNHVLLCTHGTDGAQKAENFVFKTLERNPDLKVSVLTVLDEDWRGMTGDDWLNSSKTHTDFLDHVEQQVSEEIAADWQRIKTSHPIASRVEFIQRTGKIAETITQVASTLNCDLIVIGPYRKSKRFSIHSKDMDMGLKARMENKKLHPLLPCPLLIAP